MNYSKDDTEAIAQWLSEGGKVALPPKRYEMFHRAQFVYQLLLEYRSEKVVLQHAKANDGDQYSYIARRRDLTLAKYLFGYRDPGSWEFTSGMVMDWCLEMMAVAAKARDVKSWSTAAMVLYKYAGGDKANERPFDPATLRDPIPREISSDPRLVGAKHDPDLERKLIQLLGEKRMKGVTIAPIPPTDFEEMPPDAGSAG